MNKRVSVVITTYKRPITLERAIKSVLNQTYDNIEIIVVDDNDEESEYRKITQDIMTKYEKNKKIKYIKHKLNKNGAAARNTGIDNSSGEYITFLDDDDELLKDKIKLQVEKLDNMPIEYGVVYSGYEIIRNNRLIKKKNVSKEGILSKELLKLDWGFGSGSNPLFRKEVFDVIGYFDTSFRRHHDWEVMLRTFEHYRICSICKILLRIYSDSKINVPDPETYILIKEKYLLKFNKYIEGLDERDRNIIYKKQWLVVAKLFLMKGDYKKYKIFFKRANSYSKITMIEKIKLTFNRVVSNATWIYNFLDLVCANRIKIKNFLNNMLN